VSRHWVSRSANPHDHLRKRIVRHQFAQVTRRDGVGVAFPTRQWNIESVTDSVARSLMVGVAVCESVLCNGLPIQRPEHLADIHPRARIEKDAIREVGIGAVTRHQRNLVEVVDELFHLKM